MNSHTGDTASLNQYSTAQFTRPLQIGTFVIGAEAPFQYLEGDPAFYALTGYNRDALSNAVLATFIHPQEAETVYSEISTQLGISNEVRLLCQFKKMDGSFLMVQMIGVYYQLDNNLSVLKCTVEEYSPTKTKHTNRVQTSSDLEGFAMNMGCGISKHLLNHQLSLLWANDTFYQLAGYTKEEWHDTFDGNVLEVIYNKDLAQVINQVADITEHNNSQVDCRIRCKDGSIKWIHVVGSFSGEMENNFRIVNLISFDVTPIMQAENTARIAMDQYRTLSNISEEIAFEYSFGTDTLEFANRYQKCFDFPQYIVNPRAISETTPYISKETRGAFDHFVQVIFGGAVSGHEEFQIREKSGNYAWYSATFSAIYDENENQIKSIGLLRNIEAQKMEQEKLLKKSQLDTATELYNKAATEHFIKKSLTMLSAAKTDALMIIDIDDFKNINDTYGHLMGDEAILDIANAMKSVVTANDLPGRIGGDEFAIYFRDILDPNILTEKADIIAEKLRKAYPEGGEKPKVTLSIGIATAKTGVTYEQLLEHADTALYRAKAKGKNCNVLYMDEMERDEYVNQRETTKLDKFQEVSNALIEGCYRANSTDNAVSQAFAVLGNNLPIDKIGIFEFGTDENHLNCSYQWNRNPLDSTKGKEQGVAAAPFIELYNLGNNSIFYTQDTRNITMIHRESVPDPSYICKLAVAKIEHNNKIIGFFSVASKDVEQGWSEDILKLFTLTTRLLGTQLKLRQTQEQLNELLATSEKDN